MSRRNHNGYENDNFVDDTYNQNYEDDSDYDPEEDVDGGIGGYGPYSQGKARSGPGDRKLDGGRDRRKNPSGNNYDDYDDYDDEDDDDDDYDDYDNNYRGQGGYGPYSTGKARSGPGNRRLDGGTDGRKRPGGNNPQGYNGYTAGNNRNRGRSQSRANYRRSNYNNYNDDSDDYNDNGQGQGGYGPYSTGKARSGPGNRRLDGGPDGRKRPGGNNPQGYNGYGNNRNRSRSQGRTNNRRSNYNDDDDNSDYDYNNRQGQGGYGPYSTGKARSGPGNRRLDGGPDGRKRPGGNNPQGYNGYTAGNNNSNRNRNRNYQNDNDDDNDSDDYGQNTRKQSNYGYNNNNNNNNTGRQNRSGPGDRRLDGGRDHRKKPNRSENYNDNY